MPGCVRGGYGGHRRSGQATGPRPSSEGRLDQRDPDYIRDQLPGNCCSRRCTSRRRRGLNRIPSKAGFADRQPQRGDIRPDMFVFTLAFCSYFGVEWPFFELAHNLVVWFPPLRWLRKFGTVAASQNARPRSSAAPPCWTIRAAIMRCPPIVATTRRRLGGRKSFIRFAARPACRCRGIQRRWRGEGAVPRPRAMAGRAADGRQLLRLKSVPTRWRCRGG